MNINAQKVFEFVLMLIIFYGVYSLFDGAANYMYENPNTVWVVIISLVIAAGMLLLYSYMIKNTADKKSRAKIKDLEKRVEEKEAALDSAFRIKRETEEAAEQTIND
tara:strand:- start:365 stop:685 length:321 start_codon:yes stop_codon:yes gene_type:complete